MGIKGAFHVEEQLNILRIDIFTPNPMGFNLPTAEFLPYFNGQVIIPNILFHAEDSRKLGFVF